MEIRFSKSAAKALLRSNEASLLRRKIDELAVRPIEEFANVKRLQGRDEYRLRVQDWRIIFRVEADTVWIDEIGPRGSIY